MDSNLQEIKRRLPLPQLMAQLGLADHVKKSSRCPFHEDARSSFSVFQEASGLWFWKCWAGCGSGDEIDFLERTRKLSTNDAIQEYKRMAGITESAPPRNEALSKSPNGGTFNWLDCVAAFTPAAAERLKTWRDYSPGFVSWLQANNLVGLRSGEQIAFPVHDDTGTVISAHYRFESKEGGAAWAYCPSGKGSHPLIIGSLADADAILCFESQWDGFSVMDRLGWHTQIGVPGTAVFITRGASNAKMISGRIPPEVKLYAFTQNDKAGQQWLEQISAYANVPVLKVVTPSPHKDVNDWTRAGATKQDIWAAIHNAKPTSVPAVEMPANPSIEINDGDAVDAEDKPPSPFPVEALPPVLRDMAVAISATFGIPVTLPACCVLGAASGAIGSGLDVQSGSEQKTRVNLYIIASAESGSGKSKVFRTVLDPLFSYEDSIIRNWKKEIGPAIFAEKLFLETEIENKTKQINKCADTDNKLKEKIHDDIALKKARIEELKTQVVPCLTTADVTTEAMATLMSGNHEVLFSASADARKLIDNLLGRYSGSATKNSKTRIADDSFYLQSYSGDRIRVDRQTRNPVLLEKPCLGLLWLIQPDVVERMLGEQSLQEGGFLARILICHSLAEPKRIGEETVSIPSGIRANWETLITNLLSTYHRTESQCTVQPSAAAKLRLDAHYNSIVDRLATDLHDVRSFSIRWTEGAWKLSGLFHGIIHQKDAGNHPLALETAEAAIAVADWFSEQQLHILFAGRQKEARKREDAIFELLEDKQKREHKDYITERDTLRARIVYKADQAHRLLTRMVQSGLLSVQDVPPPASKGGHTEHRYRCVSGHNPVPG